MTEQFAETDLARLRGELLDPNLDNFQRAEFIRDFLMIRGYGASRQDVIAKIGESNMRPFPSPKLQEILESCAYAA
jgi:hypothetical protein